MQMVSLRLYTVSQRVFEAHFEQSQHCRLLYMYTFHSHDSVYAKISWIEAQNRGGGTLDNVFLSET